MKRNREIVVVCHCILNCNSKVEGLSEFKGAQNIAIDLINRGYGIIQLPCPEMIMYGINRWGHVKEQFDNLFFREQCRQMLIPHVRQFDEYLKNDYDIKSIIAIDGSPSCGYNKTCSSKRWFGELSGCNELIDKINDIQMVEGKGIFIEELEKLLKEYNLEIPIVGFDEIREDK
ncbi:CD3072 family TudS-related putative desulfidase [Clostridioides difficile]|uniref:CD3072 family TudS-related putative desulfidase n=1 Tax=Clostridioides difficile TaxID=1496 RepID=UPI001C1848D4|nr:CD3072 family TudS-related putative desulfidase [Clostridioides difficile]MDF3815598.1 hypothetical protein [Clostridioides difficile]HBF4283528.1 hypothetical protein [Clostridioides difficile]HBF5047092.1 hypothetical protein [Clostridioides difficile]HBF5113554.1 hypothetical protein [Clostridioides difficile]HBF5876145.1 hypothetical protein [Clostridioides difficile]